MFTTFRERLKAVTEVNIMVIASLEEVAIKYTFLCFVELQVKDFELWSHIFEMKKICLEFGEVVDGNDEGALKQIRANKNFWFQC